ncbi:hypothetical protein NE857_09160 [Nocardiopsis exhalans]|uniref:Tail terminator n=1 Tax=Nocardiopsis exhalans TaxID=163604 RepID=A0ABY5DCS1_9ACTN|nr:hypothetical protein [Nocardiopsis exhalans]USY21750.1 hypothetical protein NE857_09160 [Nocardiopsis exhalans]
MIWPDAEETVAWVLARLTPGRDVVSVMNGLPADLPLIRVTRIGGSDDLVTDTARVEVVVYAATRAEAHALAERARSLLLPGRHQTPHGGIDHVFTEVGPHERPTAEPRRVRRWGAVYRVSARRR